MEGLKETEPIKTDVVVEPKTMATLLPQVSKTNLEVTEPVKDVKVEPESKESVIAKIGKKISDFVTGGKEKEGDFIPDTFTEAATKAGWSEEDIKNFADDYEDEELLEMIPSLTTDSGEPVKPVTEVKESEKKEVKEVKVENSQADEKTQKLLARIEALEKAQAKSQEDVEKQQTANIINRASQIFDDASKEFEIFGTTEKLPRFPDGRLVQTSPQMKARGEVYDLAYRLHKSGMDFDNAMSVSLNAYKGKNLTKDVKRSVIKELKGREQKLSGKRTSHESTAILESGVDVIREVARRHGKEIL